MPGFFQWQAQLVLHEKRLSFGLRSELCGLRPEEFKQTLKGLLASYAVVPPIRLRVGGRTVRTAGQGRVAPHPWKFVGAVSQSEDVCQVVGWLQNPAIPRFLLLVMINLVLAMIPIGIYLGLDKVLEQGISSLNVNQRLLVFAWPIVCLAIVGALSVISGLMGLWYRAKSEQVILDVLSE